MVHAQGVIRKRWILTCVCLLLVLYARHHTPAVWKLGSSQRQAQKLSGSAKHITKGVLEYVQIVLAEIEVNTVLMVHLALQPVPFSTSQSKASTQRSMILIHSTTRSNGARSGKAVMSHARAQGACL